MNKREFEKVLRHAQSRISERISEGVDHGNRFSGPLSGEGFLGGYRKALSDISAILNDTPIDDDRRIWHD